MHESYHTGRSEWMYYNKFMDRRVRNLLILFVLLNLTLLGIAGFAIFNGYIHFDFLENLGIKPQSGIPSLRVEANVPLSVEAGTDFTIRLHVTNDGTTSVQLTGIKIDQVILQSSVVKEIFPAPVQTQAGTDATTYGYDLELLAGEAVDFVFTMTAQSSTGVVIGNIEVNGGEVRAIALAKYSIFAFDPHNPPATPTPTWVAPVEKIPYESVVQITVMHKVDGVLKPAWSGSGSIISADGLILTSARTVMPRKNYPVDALYVSLSVQPNLPPEVMYQAVVLQVDPEIDLAVILVNTDMDGNAIDNSKLKLPFVSLGRVENLSAGTKLNILGYPLINSKNIERIEVTIDAISTERILLQNTLTGGFSGGLAANEEGALIGIPTQEGFRGENQFTSCQAIADTNRDGKVDAFDDCAPTGGLMDTLLPIDLALPLVDAARRGEVDLMGTDQPKLGLPAQGKVLLVDDFSDPQSGWQIFDDSDGWGQFSNDQYRIQVKRENTELYSLHKANYGDVILQLKTGVVSPTGYGDRGVICRYKNKDSYYLLAISEDGYYGIFKREKERMVALLDWQFSEQVPRYAPATLTVACVGDGLTLAVNGVVLGQAVDESYVNGWVGLSAGTWDTPGFVAFFDDLEIRKP
jgi:hypothetical protein